MRLQELFSGYVNQLDPVSRTEEFKDKQQSDKKNSALPISWGNDSVSFSPEAMAAAATASESKNSQENSGQDPSASEQFSTYMTEKRSRAKSDVDYEAQLKALQNKLKGLESQLVKVTENEMPDAAKEGQISNLNAQINSVIKEIDRVSQLAATAKQEGDSEQEA